VDDRETSSAALDQALRVQAGMADPVEVHLQHQVFAAFVHEDVVECAVAWAGPGELEGVVVVAELDAGGFQSGDHRAGVC
jgi:hypothetical protein